MCSKETQKCAFDKYKREEILPVCCKNNLLEMIKFTIGILNSYNFRYFLDFGTLLGCVRNGRIIPYDNDGDISILDDDRKNLDNLIANLSKKYFLVKMNKEKTFYKVFLSKINRLHLDIHIRKYKDGYYLSQYSLRNWGITKNDLLPLKLSSFEGLEVKIPNNYKKYLENGYGKDCLFRHKRKDQYKAKY